MHRIFSGFRQKDGVRGAQRRPREGHRHLHRRGQETEVGAPKYKKPETQFHHLWRGNTNVPFLVAEKKDYYFDKSQGHGQVQVNACAAGEVNKTAPKCHCARTNNKDINRNGNCYKSGGQDTSGWCFLEFVTDPANPTKRCYADAKWSKADGRYWSAEACKHVKTALVATRAPPTPTTRPTPHPPTPSTTEIPAPTTRPPPTPPPTTRPYVPTMSRKDFIDISVKAPLWNKPSTYPRPPQEFSTNA